MVGRDGVEREQQALHQREVDLRRGRGLTLGHGGRRARQLSLQRRVHRGQHGDGLRGGQVGRHLGQRLACGHSHVVRQRRNDRHDVGDEDVDPRVGAGATAEVGLRGLECVREAAHRLDIRRLELIATHTGLRRHDSQQLLLALLALQRLQGAGERQQLLQHWLRHTGGPLGHLLDQPRLHVLRSLQVVAEQVEHRALRHELRYLGTEGLVVANDVTACP